MTSPAVGAFDRVPPHVVLLLAGLTFVWGVNWPVMKICLAEIPVWTFRSSLPLIGGLIMLSVAWLSGQRILVPRAQVLPLLSASLLNITGFLILSAYGIRLIASGRAVVIAYTMPVWASLLGALFLGERFSLRQGAALVLGVSGIGVLLSDSIGDVHRSPLGIAFMVAASVSWASGIVLLKHMTGRLPPLTFTAWQLVIGGLSMAPIALLFEMEEWRPWSAPVVAGYLFNLMGPITICYYAWVRVISLIPASVAAIGTLLVPAVGVATGTLLLNERLGWRDAAALALVCAAAGLVLLRHSKRPAIRA
ncbi:MAG: DMT family transporter [Rhodospirillales bacterium]|nr:DMT family transporter [Rhodospirillales bacterium]